MADYKVPGQHTFKGLNFAGVMTDEVLERVPDFKFREDDVLLATYPKAGTTWVQHIAWLILNEVDIETSRKIPLPARSPFLEMSAKGLAGIDKALDVKSPRLLKSHLPCMFFKDSIENPEKPTFKVIVVMRNVRDLLVSLYHFYRMNKMLGNFDRDFAAFFELFKKRKLVIGDYFEHTLGWWQYKDNPNFLFVKYEDMHTDLKGEVVKIATFLGKDLTETQLNCIITESTFMSMKDNPMVNYDDAPPFNKEISKFMRKGEIGDWQNYFTEEMVTFVDSRCKKELEPVGLSFDYYAPK